MERRGIVLLLLRVGHVGYRGHRDLAHLVLGVEVHLRAMGSPWFEDERDDKPEDDQEQEEDALPAPGIFLVPAESSRGGEDDGRRVMSEKVKSAWVLE